MAAVEAIQKQYEEAKKGLERRFVDKVDKLQRGDELPPGVMKMVKVFVAVKRKIQPGDKMAGRHGNKGVVSMIVPCEDMPFLEDGTHVDVVLNPLGVPSRMNVGQILETHLGWACRGLGRVIDKALEEYHASGKATAVKEALTRIYAGRDEVESLTDEEKIALSRQMRNGVPIATPVFDGAREPNIVEMLKLAGFDLPGQVTLSTVARRALRPQGHRRPQVRPEAAPSVDDKIDCPLIGPDSLVTQQPLGGKAQFRWSALGQRRSGRSRPTGAAITPQETLTVKSDDRADAPRSTRRSSGATNLRGRHSRASTCWSRRCARSDRMSSWSNSEVPPPIEDEGSPALQPRPQLPLPWPSSWDRRPAPRQRAPPLRDMRPTANVGWAKGPRSGDSR